MSRSQYKLVHLNKEVLLASFKSDKTSNNYKSLKKKKEKEKYVKLYKRNSSMPFLFTNNVLEISKGGGEVSDNLKALGLGPRFKNYTYKNTQLGLKVGEFSPTRHKANHNRKKIRKVAKKRKNKSSNKIFNLKKKGFFTS